MLVARARSLSHGFDTLTSAGRELLLPPGPIAADTDTQRRLRRLAERDGRTRRTVAVRGELDRRVVEGLGLGATIVGTAPFATSGGWRGGELAPPTGRLVLVAVPRCSMGRLSMLIRLQAHARALGLPLIWSLPERAARALDVRAEALSLPLLLTRVRAVVTTDPSILCDAMRAGRGAALIDDLPNPQAATDVWWHASEFRKPGVHAAARVTDPALTRVHTDPSALFGAILAPGVEAKRRRAAVLRLCEDPRTDGVVTMLRWLGRSPRVRYDAPRSVVRVSDPELAAAI